MQAATDDSAAALAPLPASWLAFRKNEAALGCSPVDSRRTVSELFIASILDSPRQYFVTTPGDPSRAPASADRSSYSSPAWCLGDRSPAYPFSRSLATFQPAVSPLVASSPSLGVTSLGAPHSLVGSDSPAPALSCDFPSLVPAHDCADEEDAQQEAVLRVAEAVQMLRFFVVADRHESIGEVLTPKISPHSTQLPLRRRTPSSSSSSSRSLGMNASAQSTAAGAFASALAATGSGLSSIASKALPVMHDLRAVSFAAASSAPTAPTVAAVPAAAAPTISRHLASRMSALVDDAAADTSLGHGLAKGFQAAAAATATAEACVSASGDDSSRRQLRGSWSLSRVADEAEAKRAADADFRAATTAAAAAAAVPSSAELPRAACAAPKPPKYPQSPQHHRGRSSAPLTPSREPFEVSAAAATAAASAAAGGDRMATLPDVGACADNSAFSADAVTLNPIQRIANAQQGLLRDQLLGISSSADQNMPLQLHAKYAARDEFDDDDHVNGACAHHTSASGGSRGGRVARHGMSGDAFTPSPSTSLSSSSSTLSSSASASRRLTAASPRAGKECGFSPVAQLDLLQRRLASERVLLAAATTMTDEQIVGLHAVFCATQRPQPSPGVSPSTRFASLTRAVSSADSCAMGSPAPSTPSVSSSSSLSSSSSSASSAFDLSRALGAVMNYDEFCRALAFSPTSILARQIFDLVDSRYRVGALSFLQFALCVAILSGHCREHSLARFTFDVYDLNKDGYIDFGELKAMLENSLADRGIAFAEADVSAMCASTLQMLDPERGTHIAFARYEQLVKQSPTTLNPFVVRIDDVLARLNKF